MSQSNNQIHTALESWLTAWCKLVSPLQELMLKTSFNAYLLDSKDALHKTLSYWQEKPEHLRAKLSGCAQALQVSMNVETVEGVNQEQLIAKIHETRDIVNSVLTELISETEILTEREIILLRFNLRQLMAFVSPENSICANPDVLKRAFETRGRSLLAGSRQCQQDAENSQLGLCIQRTNARQNQLGQSFAASSGAVIFQNKLMQLIHYSSPLEKQRKTPLLIVPPCINRFYVLDLVPEKSFVQWLCRQGQDVYMVSWVNPDNKLADIGFDYYVQDGCLRAMEVVRDFAQVDQINLMGYCIGGLLASIAASTNKGRKLTGSLTLLATLLDYQSPGELGVFISPRIMDALREEIEQQGILPAESMSLVFTFLREEQLFWRSIRKHYFLGEPPSWDALTFWGQDATNLAGKMLLEYLVNFYMNNCLSEPGFYFYANEQVSLSNSDVPKYVLACQSDHIAPATSVLNGVKLLNGEIRQVIASGGHVRGVINHPSENRGSFTINNNDKKNNAPVPGSWWYDWQQWVETLSQEMMDARPCSSQGYPEIEAAPGSFVRQ